MIRLRFMLIVALGLAAAACTLAESTPYPINTVGPTSTLPPFDGPTATSLPASAVPPSVTAVAPSTLPAPGGVQNPPTDTVIPATIVVTNRDLALDPVLRVENGAYVLEPGATVTVRWGGVPADGRYRFVLANQREDGGVTVLSEGAPTVVSFNVPADLAGELTATAFLPDGTQVGANPVRVVAEVAAAPEMTLNGECRYLPAALGSGEVLYADADVNSQELGRVDASGSYLHMTSREGPGSRDEVAIFHQIMNLDTGQSGWVLASAGGLLSGDCTL